MLAARGKDFVTEAAAALSLGFDGIEDDVHAGPTRRSGSREPWYPRDTEMRNERQLSIVAADELALVAARMAIAEIKPEWIGANLVIDGVPRLSHAAGRHAAVLRQRRHRQGRRAERAVPDRREIDRRACRDGRRDGRQRCCFPKAAKRLRGLVGWVEKPGTVTVGEAVSVRVPEQWDRIGARLTTRQPLRDLAVLRGTLRHVGDVVPLLPGGDALGVFLLDHRQPGIAEKDPERRLRRHRRAPAWPLPSPPDRPAPRCCGAAFILSRAP